MMDMEYEIGRLRQLAREIRSETWSLEVLAERTAAAIDHLANILSEIHEHHHPRL